MRPGGFDQREGPGVYGSREPYLPLAARPDVLVFETQPLAADVEVTGVIEANLWISSDAVDTDFTIKLIDVYPPSEDYPEGVRFESRRRDHAVPLPGVMVKSDFDDTGAGVSAQGGGLSDIQPVQEGASHPVGCFVEQLPAFRCESEYGGA